MAMHSLKNIRDLTLHLVLTGCTLDIASTEMALHHFGGVESNMIVNNLHNESLIGITVFRILSIALPIILLYVTFPSIKEWENIKNVSKKEMIFLNGNYRLLNFKAKLKFHTFGTIFCYGVIRLFISINNIMEAFLNFSIYDILSFFVNSGNYVTINIISTSIFAIISIFILMRIFDKFLYDSNTVDLME